MQKRKTGTAKAILILAFIASSLILFLKMNGEIKTLTEDKLQMAAAIEELKQELEEYKNPKGGVKYHGALSVRQGQLVYKRGEPVQLRGVSSHGILWYPQYGNYRSLRTLREQGANVFRIAVYTTEGRGYDEYPQEALLALRTTLENVLGADMYAIVDWHVLKEENPNVYLEEALEFFDTVSSLYGDEPGVIYEICNEPNGDTSWDDIKAYAEQVIPVIRKNAPRAVILVGTPNFSTKIEAAIEDPLEFDNVMYTYHFYAKYSEGGFDRRLNRAREKGIGVFVSEWGLGGDYDQEKLEQLIAESEEFLDYLDETKTSWVCWALSNKEEGHSLLRPDSRRWSGWSKEELTEYGKFIFDRLSKSGES